MPFAVHELQHRIAIVEMADHVLVAADETTDRGHQAGGDCAAAGGGEAFVLCAAESWFTAGLSHKPFGGHVDHVNGRVIAVFGGVAPCEQSVACENNTIGVGIFKAELFEPKAQFIAGTFPGQPADPVTEQRS